MLNELLIATTIVSSVGCITLMVKNNKLRNENSEYRNRLLKYSYIDKKENELQVKKFEDKMKNNNQ